MPAIPWNTGEELGKLADVRIRRGEQQLRAFGQLGGAIGTAGRILREKNDLETAQESELAALAAANDTGLTPEAAADKAQASSQSTGEIDKPVTTDAAQPPAGTADKQVGGAPPAGVTKVATPGTAAHDVVPSKQPDGASPAKPTQDNTTETGVPATKLGASDEQSAKDMHDGRAAAGAGPLDKTVLVAKGLGDKSISALGRLGGAVFGDVRRIGRQALDYTGLHPDSQQRARAIEIGHRKGVSMALDREQKSLTALGSLGIMGRAENPFGALAEYAPRSLGRLANSKQQFFDPGYGKTATANVFTALRAAYPNDPVRVLEEWNRYLDIQKNPIDAQARTTDWLLRQTPEFQRDFLAAHGQMYKPPDPLTQMMVDQLLASKNLTPDQRSWLEKLKYGFGLPGGVPPPAPPPAGGPPPRHQYPESHGAGAAADRGGPGTAAAGGEGGGAGDGPTRATRNNNPGNIKVSPYTKTFPGVAGVDPDPASDGGSFLQFESPEAGYAAMARLLQTRYAGMTIADAMPRWSGGGYGGEISPIDPSRTIASLNPRELNALTQAMAAREGYGGTREAAPSVAAAPAPARPAAPAPTQPAAAPAPTPPRPRLPSGTVEAAEPPAAAAPAPAAPAAKPPKVRPPVAAKPPPGKTPLADLGNRGKPKPGEYAGIPLETPDTGGGASFNGIPLETPGKPSFHGVPLETPTTSQGPPKATVNTGGAMPASEPTQSETPSSAAVTPTTSTTTTTLGQLGQSEAPTESPDVSIQDPNSGMISSEQPRRRRASLR